MAISIFKEIVSMKFVLLSISILSIHVSLFSQKFDIEQFGAVGDSETINTKFIQEAIDACNTNGGGEVYVPSGIFITGTLHLKSNVNLHLESGAVLKGSSNMRDYESFQRKGYDATNYGMFYTYGAENVSITGTGKIDGSEEAFFDWKKAKKIEWGGTTFTRQGNDYRKVTSGIGDGPVNPKTRPRQMIIFSQCKNVLVEDVLVSKSPFWTLHFADCDGVTVKGIKVWNSLETPNSDGIDITSSNNVTITGCDVRAGDDAICIGGYAFHYELPGYFNLRHKSGNINVTNCNLQSRSSGIRIGFEDQNSVSNINISNVNITNSNRGIGIFLRDSGSIQNVNISNVNIDTRLHTGDWWGNGEPIHISAIRSKSGGSIGTISNINFRDINCTSENGILVYGTDESIINNIRFENIRLNLVNSDLNQYAGGNIDLRGCLDSKQQLFAHDIPGFYVQFVNGLYIRDFYLMWDSSISYRFFTNALSVSNFKNVIVENFNGKSSPANQYLKPVYFYKGENLRYNLKKRDVKIKKVKGVTKV